jgi:tetrapyrrole methylase family protein / MazG family protein
VLTLVGLGAGDADTLSRGAERALREASRHHREGNGRLFLRTARHPVVDFLRVEGLQFEPFDALYDAATDFDSLYAEIAARVLEAARQTAANGEPLPVTYAVPGHPLFGEDTVRRIREGAEECGLPVALVSSGSFVEATLTAVGASLGAGCDVRNALDLSAADTVSRSGERVGGRVDVSRGLLLFQVFDPVSASHAKLALMRDYPDEWEIALVQNAGVSGQEAVRRVPLYRLDREPMDHLTSVYIPPLPPHLRRPTFDSLVGIMARLRAPDGCPWDREQDHKTLRKYFIEETYEVIEAIDADEPEKLCEELGDALLQVVFHAQLASEEGFFTSDDVAARIVEKLVRRHPHVFGEIDVADSDEVLRNWERIKREEKGDAAPQSILDNVPRGLPALMQAMEISKRVVKVGFEWNAFADVLAKVDEELAELKAELASDTPDRDKIFAELGDLLFTMVQIARWQKMDPEEALRTMLGRFAARFRYIERRAREQQRDLNTMSLAEMDALWNEAKAQNL